jgi:hypothetical protein
MSNEKQIIVPTLGLYQGRAKHLVPRKDLGNNIQEIGLSYCRNVSLSRKQACIMKSKGITDFTASATGASDSVRGIGILNKYAREEEFQSTNVSITQVDGSGEDAMAYGATDYSTSSTVLQAGSLGSTSTGSPSIPGQSTDDVYTDDTTFFTTTQYIYFGSKGLGVAYSAGIRFPGQIKLGALRVREP